MLDLLAVAAAIYVGVVFVVCTAIALGCDACRWYARKQVEHDAQAEAEREAAEARAEAEFLARADVEMTAWLRARSEAQHPSNWDGRS